MSSTLLIVVFVIQLALYLINSIGARTINELLWQLYIRLPLTPSKSLKAQLALRTDVLRLKREMAAISAQDDFARWAKLRRQHDKALTEYDAVKLSTDSARVSFDTKAGVIRWTLITGLRWGLQFWHAKTPIFEYPRGWVPWYVEWALAFPRCKRGGVSINVWSAACATVVSLVGEVVGYLVVMVQGNGPKQKGEPMKMGAGGVIGQKEL